MDTILDPPVFRTPLCPCAPSLPLSVPPPHHSLCPVLPAQAIAQWRKHPTLHRGGAGSGAKIGFQLGLIPLNCIFPLQNGPLMGQVGGWGGRHGPKRGVGRP